MRVRETHGSALVCVPCCGGLWTRQDPSPGIWGISASAVKTWSFSPFQIDSNLPFKYLFHSLGISLLPFMSASLLFLLQSLPAVLASFILALGWSLRHKPWKGFSLQWMSLSLVLPATDGLRLSLGTSGSDVPKLQENTGLPELLSRPLLNVNRALLCLFHNETEPFLNFWSYSSSLELVCPGPF